MPILVLLIINTQRLQCRGAAGTIWADSRPCAECAKGRITAFTLLWLRYPYLPINPDNISMGDGESHPATTAVPPPVPIAAHNDTCFCNPARASSHSSSSPPPSLLASCVAPSLISLFCFRSTELQRERHFASESSRMSRPLQRFHWPRAESESIPSVPIGPKAHINHAPCPAHSLCGCHYWSVLIG